MRRFLLIHYSEIGLKRGNKAYFVRILKERIREKLSGSFGGTFQVRESLERFLVPLPDDFEEEGYSAVLGRVCGIRNFQYVYEGSTDLSRLSEEIFEVLPGIEGYAHFCVRAKRSQTLPYSSHEAEREVGAALIGRGIGLPVRLHDPDLEINIEFFNNHGYFSFKKYEGPGGLPVGSSAPLVSLISSGIDSPVASYRMMRRGARMIFVHFHSYPYSDMESQEQVKELVRILSGYQFSTKLYLLPFGKVQRQIASDTTIPAKDRMLLYRRLMLRIAERIAFREKAKGLVTGDNLGQVASQTADNLVAVHAASTLPLFQPLISFDKEDIVREARRIGTYEISRLPCKDTCVMFSPRSPELHGISKVLESYEMHLPVDEWIREVHESAEIVSF